MIDHDALDQFTSSCAALGAEVFGRRQVADLRQARVGFERLTAQYPDQCDGWLGLAASGATDRVVLESAYRALDTAGELISAADVAADAVDFPFDTGLYVQLHARGADGEVQAYTPSENEHRHGILDVSIVPARLPAERLAEAQAIARAIAEKLDYVGTLAVEFFLVGGALKVNELAPRPHNSGHWTLDACAVSQFEQQVRALCGLPLGNPEAKQAAVMVNLLGDLWFDAQGTAREPDWTAIAAPDLTLHLYGKNDARPGRKMGHYTVLGDAVAPLRERAEACRAALAPESATPAAQVQRAA